MLVPYSLKSTTGCVPIEQGKLCSVFDFLKKHLFQLLEHTIKLPVQGHETFFVEMCRAQHASIFRKNDIIGTLFEKKIVPPFSCHYIIAELLFLYFYSGWQVGILTVQRQGMTCKDLPKGLVSQIFSLNHPQKVLKVQFSHPNIRSFSISISRKMRSLPVLDSSRNFFRVIPKSWHFVKNDGEEMVELSLSNLFCWWSSLITSYLLT